MRGTAWRQALWAVLLSLLAAAASAKTLPLPDGLVALNSPQGEQALVRSPAKAAYWELSLQFVTQKTQSFCGVASMVMVLNAAGVPAPPTPELEPYRVFTQDNILNEKTEAILPQSTIARQGITLDQLGGLVQSFGLTASVHHAADGSLAAFRDAAREQLAVPGRYVLVNYLRRAIGQERGGHISPLAAYDADSDSFLILDVARYKYPPVWVKAAALFDAMNTPDSDNGNRSRGYVLIGGGP
jgi:hypothetical protein